MNIKRINGWPLIFVLFLVLSVSGCMSGPQLGERPAANTMDAVEAYLRKYQPGPEPRLFQTTRIYDRNGQLLAERWQEGRRTWLPLNRISQHLIDATIATEDSTFYGNTGVDPVRVVGAMLQNYEEGEIVAGAGTITMQLARNLFFGPDQRYDQTMDRKVLEAGLAQELNTLFTKDEILEMYLNLLNYSHLTYGPEAASQLYFGKPASDLTMAEATLLAGIPQRPADLDLFENFQAAKARQRVVLDMMVRHNRLTQAESDAIFVEPVRLISEAAPTATLAPHFVQYLDEYLNAKMGGDMLGRGGLTITSTLDVEMQTLAQQTVTTKVGELRAKHDLTNGALVAMRPSNGEVLAMVGSADFANEKISGQVNVSISERQPGSAIKPVLYAVAISDTLISPNTVLWDVPVNFVTAVDLSGAGKDRLYTPRNYDGKFRGPVTVRTALANSLNVPTVKLLAGVTVDRMIEGAKALGVHSLDDGRDYGLSLTLGGGEVTLLELTSAYSTLGNGGILTEANPVLAATDALGRPVDTGGNTEPVQAVSPGAAFIVTDILSDNNARKPMFGVNSPLKLSRPAAAKTGTTTDFRDNWTVGFTRYLATGVWAGNADGHPMKNTTGLTGAAPIWHDFMEAVIANPRLRELIGAPDDPANPAAGWEFVPPPDVELRPDCPPGLTCREGGEYYTKEWLAAAGEAGPLADSVGNMPTAPVYADRGGMTWTAYCEVEPAAVRTVLKLPGELGLPAPGGVFTGTAATKITDQIAKEQLHVMAWSLRHSLAINLGPCDTLTQIASKALALDQKLGPGVSRVVVDLSAALDPNVGGAAAAGGDAPISVYAPVGASTRYQLIQPVTNHASCPGHYLLGEILNREGNPVAGIRITLIDSWGNTAEAISKSGETDYGLFDFPLNSAANQYTVTVVDDTGAPISPPTVVDHLQGSAGDAPCHTIIFQGN